MEKTMKDVDSKGDGKIDMEEWKEYAAKNPSLLKIMTLPYLKDADLVQRIGAATSLELRASGTHYTCAPCVVVCKDPRWGRCFESYSEDNQIVRKMTLVSDLQGQSPERHPRGYPFVAGRNLSLLMLKMIWIWLGAALLQMC